jgi:hypothetical protein
MFHPDDRYFIMARGDPATVLGFKDTVAAVRYFEAAYAGAHGLSAGHSAGAVLNFLQLRPRVFSFGSIDDLVAILGDTVRALKLSGDGVFETVFEVTNLDLAQKTYEAGIEPRLAPNRV